MTAFVSLLLFTGISLQDPAERMLELATADQPLVSHAVIDAPVADVWKAFTTTEGIKSWMVAEGDFDLRIGGKMRTGYQPGTDLNGPSAIENTVLAFDPERMLTIRNTKAPEKFPFKDAIGKVWTVIYFEPVGESRTKVIIRMIGYQHGEEFAKMKAFFKRGNQQTLDGLVKYFEKEGGVQ